MSGLPTLDYKAPASGLATARGGSVPVRAARDVVRFARAHGADVAALLDAAKIGPQALNDPDDRLPGTVMGRLWAAAADQTGDPDLGLHLGAHVRPDALSLVGFVMLSASTLGQALADLARYFCLFTEGVEPTFDPGGDGRSASFEMAVEPDTWSYIDLAPRHPTECMLASVVSFARALTGRRLPVLAVEFAHPAPATGTDAHRAAFGVAPVFGAPRYRLAFEPAALRWPVATASPQTLEALEWEADLLVDQLRGDVQHRTAAAIAVRLRGSVPTLADVAADLALGERTLQRQLQADGTSFRAVLDDVQCALACRLLTRTPSTLHEVAFLLGFSEPSAFHRAFKRWTGATPLGYRASHAPPPPAEAED